MKIISSFCLLLQAAGFLSGCGDSTTSETSQTPGTIEQLFPLKYGNYWMYNIKLYDTNGVKTQDRIDTWEVRSARDTLGHTLFSLLMNTRIFEYFSEDSGLFLFAGRPILTLQYPMGIGQVITMQSDSDLYPADTFRIKVELVCDETNVNIDLRFEKFPCIKYHDLTITEKNHIADTALYSYKWYSLNKGLVKEDVYDYHDRKKYLSSTKQLTGYHLN